MSYVFGAAPAPQMQPPATTTVQIAADRLQWQPLTLTPGRPHFTPPVRVPAELTNWLPLITTACIDAVQAKMQSSPLRYFLFNQMARDQYQNNSFYEFVQIVVCLLDVIASTGQAGGADPQQLITAQAQRAAELWCAKNYIEITGLRNVVDPTTQYNMQNVLIPQYQNVIAQLNQHLQKRSAGMTAPLATPTSVAPTAGYATAPALGAYSAPALPQGNLNATPGSNPFQPPHVGQPAAAGYGAQHAPQYEDAPSPYGLDRLTPAAQPQQQPQSPAPSGAQLAVSSPPVAAAATASQPVVMRAPWAQPDAPASQTAQAVVGTALAVQPAATAAAAPALPAPTPAPALAAPTAASTAAQSSPVQGQLVHYRAPGFQFQPSESYPYLPAFDPAKMDLFIELLPHGMKPRLYTYKPEELSTMDPTKHLASALFAPAPAVPEDVAQRHREEVTEQVRHVRNNRAAIGLDVNTDSDDRYALGVSEFEVWTHNEARLIRRKRDAGADGERIHVHMATGMLSELLISVRDHRDFIGDMVQCETLASAASYLREYRSGPKAVERHVYNAVEARLLGALYRFLREKLSLPATLQLTAGFADDAPELANYLGTKYGPKFKDALLDQEKSIIMSALRNAVEQVKQESLDCLLPAEMVEDAAKNPASLPPTTVFLSFNLFVVLDMYASELQLPAVIEDTPMAIREQTHPALYALAQQMFEYEVAGDRNFDRRLIKTADVGPRVVLSLERGALDPNTFLITRHHG